MISYEDVEAVIRRVGGYKPDRVLCDSDHEFAEAVIRYQTARRILRTIKAKIVLE